MPQGRADPRPPHPRPLAGECSSLYPLEELVDTIDWTPFFQTWDLAVLTQPSWRMRSLANSQQVYADGKAMLAKLIKERKLTANGVVVLLPPAGQPLKRSPCTQTNRSTRQCLTWHGLRQTDREASGEAKQVSG